MLETGKGPEGAGAGTSGTMLVLDYLKSLPEDATFSSASIHQAIGHNLSSSGVITGLLARLKSDGSIKVVGLLPDSRGHKKFLEYQTVDLSSVVVKAAKGTGGKVGRSLSGSSQRKKMADLLLSLAAQVESLPSNLDDFSISELLREVERRMKLLKKENQND